MTETAPRASSAWYRVPTWVPVTLIVAYAAVVRVTGLTKATGLFRDDAWMALSAQVPLSDALHMLVSAPGYTITLRWWLGLHEGSTLWGQAPALLWGLLGVAAVGGVVRVYRYPRWIAFTVAAVIAASPVAIAYSVRLKPYAFELVAATVLLAVTEVVRRSWRPRWLIGLAAASVFAVASSLPLASVVAGCWLALLLLGWREHRGRVVAATLATALLAAPIAAATVATMPTALAPSWSHNMLSPFGGPPSWMERLRIVVGGFCHGLIGTPMANLTEGFGFVLFALGASILAGLLILGGTRRRPEVLAPVLVLVVALLLCLAGKLPLGTGRTDEVLYPAVLLLAAVGLDRAWHIAQSLELPREFASAGLAVAVVMVAIAGAVNNAWYPMQAEGALYHDFKGFVKPGQPIVVDPKAGFTWSYQGMSSWKPVLSKNYLTGFAVQSTQPDVVLVDGLADTEQGQMDQLAKVLYPARVAWYVGISVSVFSPSDAFRPEQTELKPSPTWYHLLGMGFHPSYRFSRPGCVAVLMLR